MSTTGSRTSTPAPTSAREDWDTAAAAVKAAATELATLNTGQIRRWANDAGLLKPRMWAKVKTELRKQIDLDFDVQRAEEVAAASAELAAVSAKGIPTIELWAAGDERGSYAVVGPGDTRDTVWYGSFHAKDNVFKPGDQTSADQSAAGKAIFLATKVRDDLAAPAVRLRLHISNPHINTARMDDIATTGRILLELDVTNANPADQWCQENGYREWREIRLSDLVVDAAEQTP